LDTRDGKPANEQACKVALRRNVDLSSHLATVADGHALSEADLVFLMEYKHARGVIDLYRYCAKKTVMLGSFGLPAYPLTIQDPYGRPPEEFEECFSQIDNALQNFIHTAKQHIA
jgi:protein-tyrosine phosphatase